MLVGRHNLPLYDFVFVALAIVIAFPDQALNFLSSRTGKRYRTVHHISLQIGAFVLMEIWWAFLSLFYSLPWWTPLAFVVLAAIVRGISAFLNFLLSFLFPF